MKSIIIKIQNKDLNLFSTNLDQIEINDMPDNGRIHLETLKCKIALMLYESDSLLEELNMNISLNGISLQTASDNWFTLNDSDVLSVEITKNKVETLISESVKAHQPQPLEQRQMMQFDKSKIEFIGLLNKARALYERIEDVKKNLGHFNQSEYILVRKNDQFYDIYKIEVGQEGAVEHKTTTFFFWFHSKKSSSIIRNITYTNYLAEIQNNQLLLHRKLNDSYEEFYSSQESSAITSLKRQLLNFIAPPNSPTLSVSPRKLIVSPTKQQALYDDFIDLKIMILGDSQVGKTNLILRYRENSFSEQFIISAGENPIKKRIQFNDRCYNILLYETPPQHKIDVASMHIQPHAIIVCVDLSDRGSPEHIKDYFEELLNMLRRHHCISLKLSKIRIFPN